MFPCILCRPPASLEEKLGSSLYRAGQKFLQVYIACGGLCPEVDFPLVYSLFDRQSKWDGGGGGGHGDSNSIYIDIYVRKLPFYPELE